MKSEELFTYEEFKIFEELFKKELSFDGGLQKYDYIPYSAIIRQLDYEPKILFIGFIGKKDFNRKFKRFSNTILRAFYDEKNELSGWPGLSFTLEKIDAN